MFVKFVKFILPALTEAKSPLFRPIKYSLFPPLGLAGLAAFLPPETQIELIDEHVETLNTDDIPDLVALEVYITSARRAYQIADLYRSRGSYVVLGGLHVTSCPEEAVLHADSIFLGPGEDTWRQFLNDLRNGTPAQQYQSIERSLTSVPRFAAISFNAPYTWSPTRSWSPEAAPMFAISATKRPSFREANPSTRNRWTMH